MKTDKVMMETNITQLIFQFFNKEKLVTRLMFYSNKTKRGLGNE